MCMADDVIPLLVFLCKRLMLSLSLSLSLSRSLCLSVYVVCGRTGAAQSVPMTSCMTSVSSADGAEYRGSLVHGTLQQRPGQWTRRGWTTSSIYYPMSRLVSAPSSSSWSCQINFAKWEPGSTLNFLLGFDETRMRNKNVTKVTANKVLLWHLRVCLRCKSDLTAQWLSKRWIKQRN